MLDDPLRGTAAEDHRLPVIVVTGFLGSGKTTVLNGLLRRTEFAGTAVIINEFGEIGLDHELVTHTTEEMVLLSSGCLCCTIRGDLVETLGRLVDRLDRGEGAGFARVMIETTGLADPAPILHTLMTDAALTRRYRLDGVIATVDAAVGMATLDRHEEAVKQVAVADRILLTKSDMVSRGEIEALLQRLDRLNPAAPVIRAINGAVEPSALLAVGAFDPGEKIPDVRRWLDAEAYAGHDHHGHAHDVNRHDDHIRAVCLTLTEPVSGRAFNMWMEFLLMLKGPDLLRMKGLVNIRELPGPLLIHGIQHIFHPPRMLPEWPGDDRRSRLVFIARDMEERTFRDTLGIFTADDAPPTIIPLDAPLRVEADGTVTMYDDRM
jgi:G3E family GTPase